MFERDQQAPGRKRTAIDRDVLAEVQVFLEIQCESWSVVAAKLDLDLRLARRMPQQPVLVSPEVEHTSTLSDVPGRST
jgi:hypothetical protein